MSNLSPKRSRRTEPAPPPSRRRPVDLVHLARTTHGDRQAEAQILALMARQIECIGRGLPLALPAERVRLAAALGSTARTVGAFLLSEAAERVVAEDDEAAMAGLQDALDRTATFLRTLDAT
ncbi:hypothetical protein NPA31_005430 [Aurantimonas sp. MSK8Z-1]|uniref:hypothetical protein n=1 Tax=Mangrovibrevibacter kandeliae TaxID=2968473 RepID=UPI00211967E3|nr:hypothetical protein [Aurantimonas sp. MSK8Z-1]MCW4114403.1 hypothetical protein [Aurantimonas sp. MSK8Z-1]